MELPVQKQGPRRPRLFLGSLDGAVPKLVSDATSRVESGRKTLGGHFTNAGAEFRALYLSLLAATWVAMAFLLSG